jgi:CRP-like cAMP-binding protein
MISRDTFLEHLQDHPDALAPILDMALEMYRIHSERIINLEYRSVRERLISFLITMGHRFGRETTEGLLIDVPLRHQDIASSINASRETASRELSALERKGLLLNKQSLITLVNVEKLQTYL